MALRMFTTILFPTCKPGNLGLFAAVRVPAGMGIAFPVAGVRLIRALDVAVAVWLVAWVEFERLGLRGRTVSPRVEADPILPQETPEKIIRPSR